MNILMFLGNLPVIYRMQREILKYNFDSLLCIINKAPTAGFYNWCMNATE